MKIMYVHKDINTNVNAGGINTVYLKHIEELSKTDNEIIAVTSRDGNWGMDAKRYIISTDRATRANELKRIIKMEKPDIVDVFSWGAELVDYVEEPHSEQIVMRGDIPMRYYGLNPIDEKMAKACSQVVSISKWCDFEWSSVLGKNTIIIPHASDRVLTVNKNKKKKSVLWVGKATETKGFDLLFNLPKEYFKEFDTTIVCAKTKFTDVSLFDKLSRLGVTIRENLSQEEYNEILSNTEFVLSTARKEGFCIAVLEAMKHGAIPVVPYWIGGTTDFVNCQNGIIYKNLEDCYQQMHNLRNLTAYSNAAIEEANKYNWDEVVHKSLKLYKGLLK